MELPSKSAVAEATRAATRSRAAFDLKGVVTPLTVLRLRTTDLNLVERQLRAKMTQMPTFFADAPIVLDLSGLEGGIAGLPLPTLVHMLRHLRVVPVGATGAAEGDREALRAAGLAIIQTGPARARDEATVVAEEPGAPPEPVEVKPAPAPAPVRRAAAATPVVAVVPAPAIDPHRPPLVVRTAVRGGQVVYARKTDLIVLAPVNVGAQIFADGHIHIYSTLRGRAMAGAQGLTEARIFVQKLEAELVAVAGAYVMADDMPVSLRGKAAQVHLEGGECRVSAL